MLLSISSPSSTVTMGRLRSPSRRTSAHPLDSPVWCSGGVCRHAYQPWRLILRTSMLKCCINLQTIITKDVRSCFHHKKFTRNRVLAYLPVVLVGLSITRQWGYPRPSKILNESWIQNSFRLYTARGESRTEFWVVETTRIYGIKRFKVSTPSPLLLY